MSPGCRARRQRQRQRHFDSEDHAGIRPVWQPKAAKLLV
jgi:hypothetical protein